MSLSLSLSLHEAVRSTHRGAVCDTPSPEFITMPGVGLEPHRDKKNLDSHVHGGHFERLDHGLRHALTVGLEEP